MSSRLRIFLRYTRRYPLPIWAGLGVVGFLHLRRQLREEQSEPLTLSLYKFLPLRALSRATGCVAEAEIPSWARSAILGGYAKAFGCLMEEAEVTDLHEYASLGQLFRRRLKSEARPIDFNSSGIVSPCDGKILHCGKVNSCGTKLEQVKGISYELDTFLGESPSLQRTDDNCLYYSILYLAPGDYHGFHSAVEMKVQRRSHFTGLLLSVGPWVARKVPGLFNINERVAYCGEWKHGYFSLTAVGATNVGCVKVAIDKELNTNSKAWNGIEKKQHVFTDPALLKKGEYFGEFNLGSTIVLVYEAPKAHKFNIKPGERVKMGQLLARMDYSNNIIGHMSYPSEGFMKVYYGIRKRAMNQGYGHQS